MSAQKPGVLRKVAGRIKRGRQSTKRILPERGVKPMLVAFTMDMSLGMSGLGGICQTTRGSGEGFSKEVCPEITRSARSGAEKEGDRPGKETTAGPETLTTDRKQIRLKRKLSGPGHTAGRFREKTQDPPVRQRRTERRSSPKTSNGGRGIEKDGRHCPEAPETGTEN